MATDLDNKVNERQDEAANPYSDKSTDARQLRDRESGAHDSLDRYDRSNDGLDDHPISAGIADAEEQAGKSWSTNVTPKSYKKASASDRFKTTLRKRGPLGIIVSFLIGGGILSGGPLISGGLLVNLQHVLTQKLDTVSASLDERAIVNMRGRMFSTKGSCVIFKSRCRFAGLTETQMKRLEFMGAQLVDENGKPVAKSALRYRGGKTLILKSGEKITSDKFVVRMLGVDEVGQELRSLQHSVFAPRLIAFNDKLAREMRAHRKMTSNPDWGSDDSDESTRKAVHAASTGESYSVQATDTTQYQKGPDGQVLIDANGDPIPVNDPGATNIDFGVDADDIQDQVEKITAAAEAGEVIQALPSEPSEVALLPDYEPSNPASPIKKAIGFLSPAAALDGVCTVYQLTNMLVTSTKTIKRTNDMRYESQFLATSSKQIAGDALPSEISKPASILMKENKSGETFGDSPTYQNAVYGTTSGTSPAASGAGNATILVLSTILNTVNNSLGGETFVRKSCGILTNPFVQGALALTSFIPGGGQIAKGVSTLISKGSTTVAKELVEKSVAKMVEKNITKDSLKAATKDATKQLSKMAAGPLAIFLGGYIAAKYGIPALAQTLAGGDHTGNEDGVVAADTIAHGFAATNAQTGIAHGLMPLTKDQYEEAYQFNNESNARYIADMRSSADPLDVNNPYSVGNGVAVALYNFASGLNVFRTGWLNILSVSKTIFSSLSPSRLFSSAFADTLEQRKAEVSYCQDSYMKEQNIATTITCEPIVGFSDPEMLQNTDPSDVGEWLQKDNQLDSEGNVIDDSELQKFMTDCANSDRNVNNVSEPAQRLPEKCFDKEHDTLERKYFQLYVIDASVDDSMESATPTQTSSGNTANTVFYNSVGAAW
jgi:hypothetical protein